jgi:hypothetical protein
VQSAWLLSLRWLDNLRAVDNLLLRSILQEVDKSLCDLRIRQDIEGLEMWVARGRMQTQSSELPLWLGTEWLSNFVIDPIIALIN